jgi:hypothetical protein
MSNYKNYIQTLGFEISKTGKRFGAFSTMCGGLYFEATNYMDLFNQIEVYLKDKFSPSIEIERNEYGDEYVISCNNCGNDVNEVNSKGICKNCK